MAVLLEIDIRVEYAVEETNRWTFVRVLIRQVKVNYPFAILIRRIGRPCISLLLPTKST